MKTNKKFDCVEMKRDIQQRLLEKWKGQTDQEIQRSFEEWAKGSNDRLAQWWRNICSHPDATIEHNPSATDD